MMPDPPKCAQKNPEPVRFGIEGPIIAMGRAREEGTNSGYCEMAPLETKNKSQNTPQSAENDAGFAIWRKKNPEPVQFEMRKNGKEWEVPSLRRVPSFVCATHKQAGPFSS
jgi:hypothetical protein